PHRPGPVGVRPDPGDVLPGVRGALSDGTRGSDRRIAILAAHRRWLELRRGVGSAAMSFTLFRDRFRELADRETRTITRLWDSASGLPAGQYAFVEMFCDEPGCDCRRVLFTVIDTASGRCEAVINFGWEEASFYAAWLREDDPHMVAALQGPALHFGPAQG